MKKLTQIFVVGLTVSLSNATLSSGGSSFEPFLGPWKNPTASERAPGIVFFETNHKVLGTTEIHYVDTSGQPTGEKIEYFFSFDQVVSPTQIAGTLKTFDGHYHCMLENGAATLEIMPNGDAQISFNKTYFKVRSYRQKIYDTQIPRYCPSPNPHWWPQPVICGFERVPVYGKPFGQECIITERVTVVIPLSRQ